MRGSELDRSGAGRLRDAKRNGLDSMLAVGTPPWHYAQNEDLIRLQAEGTKVTSKQVNGLAGLDWSVTKPRPTSTSASSPSSSRTVSSAGLHGSATAPVSSSSAPSEPPACHPNPTTT
jgi:hypothetical protein